jgi:hypothetical protein
VLSSFYIPGELCGPGCLDGLVFAMKNEKWKMVLASLAILGVFAVKRLALLTLGI